MPFFTYLGETERFYPDHQMPDGRGVTGVPGSDPVEMDAAPADGRWVTAPKLPKAGKKDTPSGDAQVKKENS